MDNIPNTQTGFKSDHSKIYEQLEYLPQPEDYRGKLPWLIQMQIAATNGKQYADRVGKLKGYPKYELPVKKVKGGLMLDIGCGWGRWLTAGAEKGYLPVGVDLRIEFCEACLRTLKDHNKSGYVVAADLMDLPFRKNIFDLVWSFSVIQHTHKIRLLKCLNEIHRIMKKDGIAKLEFPNKDGFRNKRGPVLQSEKRKDEFDSWVVRYYSIKEYNEMVKEIFGNFSYNVHSFLGIGVLKEDLYYVSWKNKLLCAISLAMTQISKWIPGLKSRADSIYIEARKNSFDDGQNGLIQFMEAHNNDPQNNLNIIHLLKCPLTNESLKFVNNERDYLFNSSETFKYPVINSVPVIIKSEAIKVG